MSWYRTGTVSVTSGSGTVTGSGTAWIANAKVGQAFRLEGGTVDYEITAIVSDTQMTISPGYLGTNQSGQAYAIVPVVGVYARAYEALEGAIAQWSTYVSTALSGLFQNGSAATPGISFANDPDTGFFRSAANQLSAVTGGVARWVLSSTAFQVNVPITGSAVQGDAYDDTSSVLLTPDSFGLGSVAAIAETDLDDFPQGFAITQAGGSLTNHPFTTSERAVVMTKGSAGAQFQMLITRQNSRIWFRNGITALGEYPWYELYSTFNAVGTVSQSGGNPTGAIMEQGSNANGEYIRFADGTQICTNGNAAITTNPAAFTGTVTSIDGDKLRIGRWF